MDRKNETKYKWPLAIILSFVLTSIIIYRFSNIPSPIKANTGKSDERFSKTPPFTDMNKPGSLNLAQKQNISNPNAMETTPRIEAISISSSGEPGVFIQGNYVHEGDIVDGFKILAIYSDKVEYEKNGKTITGVFPSPKTDKTGKN